MLCNTCECLVRRIIGRLDQTVPCRSRWTVTRNGNNACVDVDNSDKKFCVGAIDPRCVGPQGIEKLETARRLAKGRLGRQCLNDRPRLPRSDLSEWQHVCG